MNPEKKAVKKAARKERNRLAKVAKAAARKSNLALLGKLVYETEVDGEKVLNLPPAVRTSADGSILPLRDPSFNHNPLAFIGAKQYKQHGLSMRRRPGNAELHVEAIVENASRSLAVEIDKALNPPEVEATPIPVVPVNAAELAATV